MENTTVNASEFKAAQTVNAEISEVKTVVFKKDDGTEGASRFFEVKLPFGTIKVHSTGKVSVDGNYGRLPKEAVAKYFGEATSENAKSPIEKDAAALRRLGFTEEQIREYIAKKYMA